MKRFFLSFVAIVVTSICFAQDIIVQKDRSTIQAKVSEIGTSEVKYKKWSNQDGPLYAISKKDLYAIIYHDGKLDELCENIPESFKIWLSVAAGEIEAKYRDELDEQAYREAMRELESTSQQTREERIKNQKSNSNADKPFDPDEIVDCIFCRGGGQIPYGFTLIQCPHCLGSGKQTAGKYMRNVTLPNNATYNGGYNSGSVGSSPIRQERDLEQEKRQQKDPHNHRCFKCNETGRYTCPCHSVPTFGNKRYHQCSNCNQNHEVGTGLNPHKCKCNDCGGDGIK